MHGRLCGTFTNYSGRPKYIIINYFLVVVVVHVHWRVTLLGELIKGWTYFSFNYKSLAIVINIYIYIYSIY